MANYDAVIRLIVQGEQALKGVQSQIEDLYKTIGKIEKAGILNARATEATLQAAKEHVSELERAARATLNQVKQNEKRIIQQSKLNAAVDLYERRLTQATNSGAAGLKKFEGQIAQIEQAFSFFKDRKNVTAVQALATELGRMVEYSNTVSRNERARAASLSRLREFAKQITAYEEQGLNVSKAREKFDQLAEVTGSNQLNAVKKYTEALTRQLGLLKEKAALQAQTARDTAPLQAALAALEEEQRQLENSKLDQKALQIQAALDKQAAATAETAAQTAKLNERQLEFTERTDAAARAASRQTAEYLRMQRVAKEVARLNETAAPAQLLLSPAAPGSPAMSGGARRMVTGAVERAGGMRTADEAAMALRYAQALQEQVRPLSQIEALYAGIAKEAFDMQQIKALPDTAMLNAAARGIKQLETAEDRRNRELEESAARLREVDRLEESRARRAGKLDKIQQYIDFREDRMGMANAGFGLQGPALPPRGAAGGVPALPPRTAGMFDVPPAKGLAGFLGKPGMTDALMGAGFPLLFGGGPGAILGGGLGGFIGGQAGGMGGMALGIAASAIGQLLDKAYQQITTIATALDTLNMDALRESVITVNAQLDYQVEKLLKAGKADEARALAAEAVFKQTGLTAGAAETLANNSTRLKNAWDQATGAISAAGAQLADLFVPALTSIISLVGTVAKGWSLIFSVVTDTGNGVKGWLQDLIFGAGTADKVKEKFGGINEETEKIKAQLKASVDQQLVSAQAGKKLLDIEKQRTLDLSLQGKIRDIDLDKQAKIVQIDRTAASQKAEALLKYGGLKDAQSKKDLADLLKLIDAEAEQGRQTAGIVALREELIARNNTLVEQDKVRIALLQMQGEIAKASEDANEKVRAGQIQELEQRKQIAMSLSDELSSVNAIYTQKKQGIDAAYAATQREAELKVQIAAADLASVEAQRARGAVGDEAVAQARNVYNTAVAVTQETLRGAEAVKSAAASAADLERRQQTVAAYTAQFASEASRATNALNQQAASISNQASLVQTLNQAYITINGVKIQSLQNTLAETRDVSTRAIIIDKIKNLEIANARLVLQATLAQIDAEVARQRIAYLLVQVKYQELQATVAIAKAQGLMNRAYQDALNTQLSALNIARDAYKTSVLGAGAQRQAANAVFKGAVESARLKANTEGAARAAGQFAGSMGSAANNIQRLQTGLVNIQRPTLAPWQEALIAQYRAGAVQGTLGMNPLKSYAAGIEAELKLSSFFNKIAAQEQQKQLTAERAAFEAQYGPIPFASGGYVTGPTLGLIGEGGQSEYIIPESKMATASANYLAGGRGAGIMEGSGGSGPAPSINITTGPVMEFNGQQYVTMADMQRGMQQVADSIYRGLRKPSTRAALRMS